MNPRMIVGAALAATTIACSGGGSGEPSAGGQRTDASEAAPVADLHFIEGTFSPALGPDGNTVVYRAPEGLVVIDAGRHMAHSQKILDYAQEVGMPIAVIVNTHWHLDHATGNQDLKAAYPAARLYTTRAVEAALDGFLSAGAARAAEALRNPDLPEADRVRLQRGLSTVRERIALLPDRPVDGQMALPVVGRDLELNVTDHAVTESDVWVWDPATKTVIAGDLVTLPAPLFDTACPDGWLAALAMIDAKPHERVVPGHGFPMDRGQFRSYRIAFENLVRCANEYAGAVCAEGWLRDAAALLDAAAGRDIGDKEYARAAVEYYVDQIIRSESKRAEFCAFT